MTITKKTIIIFSVIASFALSAFFVFKNDSKVANISAASTDNIMGFAWSENIGWISFNSNNCDIDGDGTYEGASEGGGATPAPTGCQISGAVFPYGVNLDSATDNLSGYAWSENIGWISFNPTDYVDICPSGVGTCQPRYDDINNEFFGWARALNHDDGWDGWISLNCENSLVCVTSDYKVSLNGTDFEGWAWGGDVVGWISFNSTNCDSALPIGQSDGGLGCPVAGTPMSAYKVYLENNPPAATTNAVLPIDYCVSNLPAGVELMWDFSDIEDDLAGIPQTGYEINLVRSDATSCNIVKNPDNSNSVTGPEINASCPGFIDYGGHTYIWEVKVYDSAGADSGFVAEPSSFPAISTPDHRYPTANFSYSPPLPILQFQEITFDPLTPPDDSEAYGGASIVSFEWDFGDGTMPNPTSDPLIDGGIITHFYSEEGPFTVDLKVTDDTLPVAYSCWASQQLNAEGLNIGGNKPKWNEINP